MSANKTNISQIRRYLNGELDAKAMHRLEREAQDDPFLMEALEGYEAAGKDQQPNLTDLQQRLADRVAPKAGRSIILWRVLPIAASLLIAISIGYYFLDRKAPETKVALQVAPPSLREPAKPLIDRDERNTANLKVTRAPAFAKNLVEKSQQGEKKKREYNMEHLVPIVDVSKRIIIKPDTVEYKASAYPVKSNATVDELLKKMEGMEVGADGSVTHQGHAVTKARINGKDYLGGNIAAATQNLPANVIDKIQKVDDYGDQAARTSAKNIAPNKLTGLSSDTLKQTRYTQSALQGRLPGVDLKEVQIRGAATPSKKEFAQSAATIQAKDLSTLRADSVTSLAEVVVSGYPDKALPGQKAQPLNGWKTYLAYVVEQAVMPDGAIGKVKLAFTVGTDGKISGIRVLRGRNPAMNDKAVSIIQNGPKWTGEAKQKEVKLKIKFHKKTNG